MSGLAITTTATFCMLSIARVVATVITHLDAVTLTVNNMLALADMISLTSVLFKASLHRALGSMTLIFFLPSSYIIYCMYHYNTLV